MNNTQEPVLDGMTLCYGADIVAVSPVNRAVLDLWRAQAGADPMPGPGLFSPSRLAEYATKIDLADVLDGSPPTFRYRYMGVAVAELYGDMTGKGPEHYKPEAVARRVVDLMTETLTRAEPLLVTTQSILPRKQWLNVEALYLPLGSTTGRVESILGVTDRLT